MYVITGATGNTGGPMAEILLAAGEKVRVIGRKQERLERFAWQGAEIFVGDANDPTAMTRAFEGARAVYAMIPPDVTAPDALAHYEHISDSLVAAVGKARVSHVVALSSLGAHLPERTGPILGLRSFEQKLARLDGVNVLSLRPTFFMENLLPSVGLLKAMGVMGGAFRGDLAMSMIATRDIATAAANSLLRLDFSGKIARELLGQRDVTQNEVASIVGKAIGQPDLGYMQFPYAKVEEAMQHMGASASTTRLLTEMAQSFNNGYLKGQEQRTAANTTPTSIETFVTEVFAPLVMGKSAGA